MASGRTPEQVIDKVPEQTVISDGRPLVDVQVTEATWYRWLNHYEADRNSEV